MKTFRELSEAEKMKSCPKCVSGHIQDTFRKNEENEKLSERHRMKKMKSCPKCVSGHIQDTFQKEKL